MKVTRVEKLIVLLNCTVPVALLGYDALMGHLGANPVNFAIRTTGMLALVFLLLSLTVTPVARITGWNWLVLFRRTLGLYAFFHALLHLSIFFVFDRALSIRSTLSEMVVRPYLVVGSAALLLMVPLAVTSTDGMIRRLGPKRWKMLHRLAYVSAILGVLHYYMQVKADVTLPVGFAIALGLLLAFRVVYAFVRRSRAPVPSPALPSGPIATTKTTFWVGQLRVANVVDETPDVRTFRLVPIGGGAFPFSFLPGQYINLFLTIDGQPVHRSYTIASSPTRDAYCEITVKRDGVASRFLHDRVREGDLLDASGPGGRFTFTGAESPSIVMIAGGVGITPLMAKIRYLTDIAWPGDIYLAYAARTEKDLIFRDELDDLRKRHANLHVLMTLTRAEGQHWTGARGRFTAAQLLAHMPCLKQSPIHICGPDAMLEPTKQMLHDLGVTDDQIKFESFLSLSRIGVDAGANPATDMPMPATTAAPIDRANGTPADVAMVTFARSGRSITIPIATNILEASEAVGVNIDYDCRAGICGTCRVKLLSGEVRMDAEHALTYQDRKDGFILACQSHCVGPVTVEA